VKRLADVPGFHVLPKRWVVEHTFGWLFHRFGGRGSWLQNGDRRTL
jgi:transposase